MPPHRPEARTLAVPLVAALLSVLPAASTWAVAATANGAANSPAKSTAKSATSNAPGIDWQPVGGFDLARTETTIGQFRRFAEATQTTTLAERQGGGEVYGTGWERKPGWNWKTPFGSAQEANDDEPAVHITFGEAQAFCRWSGARLPTDAEWVSAAYTEQRDQPTAGFVRGKTYPFPTGDSATGAQCLGDCGPAAAARAVRHGAVLMRGDGHARVGSTPAGVNGLRDMGGNAWEWVDEPQGAGPAAERRTRGGSWWYGSAAMRADYLQSKPPETAVVYIGFRCAKSR